MATTNKTYPIGSLIKLGGRDTAIVTRHTSNGIGYRVIAVGSMADGSYPSHLIGFEGTTGMDGVTGFAPQPTSQQMPTSEATQTSTGPIKVPTTTFNGQEIVAPGQMGGLGLPSPIAGTELTQAPLEEPIYTASPGDLTSAAGREIRNPSGDVIANWVQDPVSQTWTPVSVGAGGGAAGTNIPLVEGGGTGSTGSAQETQSQIDKILDDTVLGDITRQQAFDLLTPLFGGNLQRVIDALTGAGIQEEEPPFSIDPGAITGGGGFGPGADPGAGLGAVGGTPPMIPELELLARQGQPFGQAFGRVAQDVFGGLGGINPAQGRALNALGRQSQAALPFLQAFQGFSPESLAPDPSGALPSFSAGQLPTRTEAIEGFLGSSGRERGEEFEDILGNIFARIRPQEGAISQLGGGRFASAPGQEGEFSPEVTTAVQQGDISPRTAAALLGFVGEEGRLDPSAAANVAITPFLQGLPANLRAAGQGFLGGRSRNFLAANPGASIFDVLQRFNQAGFF